METIVVAQEHGVVADRRQRDLGRLARHGEDPARVAEHARQDPERDRRLGVLEAGEGIGTGERGADTGERLGLPRIAPQLPEPLVVGHERDAQRRRRQTRHRLEHADHQLGRQAGVGQQRRRARRAVDQRHPLFDAERQLLAEIAEQPPERLDLPRAAVAVARHRW